MGKFRDKIARARGTLHDHMSVPALVYARPEFPIIPSDPLTIPETTQVTVRVHDSPMMLGDLKGTNLSYAEVSDNSPRIIFLASEYRPNRYLIVAVDPENIYEIDYVDPQSGITITAHVSRLSKEDVTNFPVPE